MTVQITYCLHEHCARKATSFHCDLPGGYRCNEHAPPLIGRPAYEADTAANPHYHDGTPRPTWEKLSDIGRWSWSRPLVRS